jgi:polysaccharide deacetylase 2 family uncharacterized protein YibQ
MGIKAEIKGTDLVITVPMNPVPVASASGKTLVVASSHGNVATTATVNGQPVTIGVNAYIRR